MLLALWIIAGLLAAVLASLWLLIFCIEQAHRESSALTVNLAASLAASIAEVRERISPRRE